MNPNAPEADVKILLTDPDPEVRYPAERSAAKRLCDSRLPQSIWLQDKQNPHADSDIADSLEEPMYSGSDFEFSEGIP